MWDNRTNERTEGAASSQFFSAIDNAPPPIGSLARSIDRYFDSATGIPNHLNAAAAAAIALPFLSPPGERE